jgi:hypothetical protein
MAIRTQLRTQESQLEKLLLDDLIPVGFHLSNVP